MQRHNIPALRAQIEAINEGLQRAERQLEANYKKGIFGQDERALALAQQTAMLENMAADAARQALKKGDEKLAALAAQHSAPALELLRYYYDKKRTPSPADYMNNPRPRRNPLPKHDPPPSAASRRQGRTLLSLSGFFNN